MKYKSSFAAFLNELYKEKKTKNSKFSKRAFAKMLGIPSSYLIRCMNGTLPITESFISKTSPALELTIEQIDVFLNDVRKTKNEQDNNHFIGIDHCEINQKIGNEKLVGLFDNWKWFCVLELSRLDDFKLQDTYISKKMGISKTKAEELIHYLLENKIFDLNGESCIKNVEDFFKVTGMNSQELSAILKNRHKMLLQELEWAIENVETSKRHMSSLVLAYDSDLYPEVCKKISTFRKEINIFLEKKSKKRDMMYDLSINFIPLTKD